MLLMQRPLSEVIDMNHLNPKNRLPTSGGTDVHLVANTLGGERIRGPTVAAASS